MDSERESLRQQLADWLGPLMTFLGLLTLVLFIIQLTATVSDRQVALLNMAQAAIWATFLVEFLAELLLACDKLAYLRANWWLAIAVLLPALRAVRALRALIALRHVNFLWLLARTNRSIEALRRIVPGRQTAYLAVVTAIVVAIGTAGVYYFEAGQPSSQIHTLGDALWWAACLVTTINNGLDPVSPEGRILAILMRIYAVGVFGLIAGQVASFLVQRRQEHAREGGE
ncbi:MAG TPA: ion transporter [Chloroflexota bacterium]